ncbi:MAG: dihydrofolate reductase [Woeseia sp.]
MSQLPVLTAVVAASTNNVIGRSGRLPWNIPEDLRRFRRLTMGKPVVMGRRTFDSIGRALPGRRNIVISRRSGLDMPGCETAESPAAALALVDAASEVMIIGGETVYAEFLPRIGRIHMTRVHATLPGDAFFPELAPEEWQVLWSEEHPAGDRSQFACRFETLERRQNLHRMHT